MRAIQKIASMVLGAVVCSGISFGADDDAKRAKWEEMKKKHEECLKSSGLSDQATIDALSDCHKSIARDPENKADKGDREAWKGKVDACLKEKGITLTAEQQNALKTCHEKHHHKD
jgi:hypothetical protein